MAGTATARRMEGGRNAASRTPLRPRMEPVLAGPSDRAVLSAPAPAGAVFRRDEGAPPVRVPPMTIDADGEAPAVQVSSAAADTASAGNAAAFAAERPVSSCPMPARRLSLSIIASIALHGAAAAAFVWLGLKAPVPISAGEEGIPVELVVAADTGSAAREETASGRQETTAPSIDSDARQAVEAPPAEAPPEMAAVEPVEAPTDTPPAAQPDPLTNAERVVDQLPPPPMPGALAVAEAPLEPPPIETHSVAEPVTAPSEHPVPQQIEAAAVTPQMAELQAAPAEPVVPPTPAPAVQPPSPPVIRREAVRSPPTRREAPTARERTRPTRQAAVTSQPERPARAARQVEARASRAERGRVPVSVTARRPTRTAPPALRRPQPSPNGASASWLISPGTRSIRKVRAMPASAAAPPSPSR